MNGIYCGPPPLPAEVWARWNLDPPLLCALILLAVVFRHNWPGRLGVAVLAVAFVSPLCALSSALFSARVLHHLLLVAVAAPLLAHCLPPSRPRPLLAPLVVSTVALWFWHIPAAYDLALADKGAYWLMQLTLGGSAVWFWRTVFTAQRSPIEALLFVVAAFAQMGLLGALLTLAPEPLYAAHAAAPFQWGMTPLVDQQLGGLLMWVPAALPYAVAATVVARRGWSMLHGGRA